MALTLLLNIMNLRRSKEMMMTFSRFSLFLVVCFSFSQTWADHEGELVAAPVITQVTYEEKVTDHMNRKVVQSSDSQYQVISKKVSCLNEVEKLVKIMANHDDGKYLAWEMESVLETPSQAAGFFVELKTSGLNYEPEEIKITLTADRSRLTPYSDASVSLEVGTDGNCDKDTIYRALFDLVGSILKILETPSFRI